MRHSTRLGLIAAITLLLYIALAALYPLAPGLLKPRHTWAMQVDANSLVALAHIGIYIALLLTYLATLSITNHQSLVTNPQSPISNLSVYLGWLAFTFVLLFSFPGESADIFDYLFRGRMMAEYGLSPLTTTPYSVQQYAFHRYVSWSQWVDAYGPLWEYASAGVSLLVYGMFLWSCDFRGWSSGIFRTLGTNSLAAYMLHDVASWIVSPFFDEKSAGAGIVMIGFLICLLMVYGACRILEAKNWYLRV